MHEAYYFVVAGRVQGVNFRASARDLACALGLRGWVRNRADGTVEGVASGPEPALNEFHEWLAKGPAAASVAHVTFEPAPGTRPGSDFRVR